MAKKQTKNNYPSLEKMVTIVGLGLIIFGCIANTFGAMTNSGFTRDVFDAIYYCRYDLLLLGGFIVGYVFTKKSTGYTKWFSGVVYAVYAIVIFELLDLLRLASQNIFGFLPFPWTKILFEGEPLTSLIVLVLVALIVRYKLQAGIVNRFMKVSLIVSLVVCQAFLLASSSYYLITNPGANDSGTSVWLTVFGYITAPLFVAIIAFLVLYRVKNVLNRSFFAVLIAAFYYILTIVLWEFRTDPSLAATNVFSIVTVVISALFGVMLLWGAHKALK